MAQVTKLLMQYPWQGGYNTTLNESVIAQNQLTKGENILIGPAGSKKKRDAINFDWDDITPGSLSVIGGHDFWYGTTSKTQKIVGINSNGTINSYTTSGVHTDISGGTSWTTPSLATFKVLNNLLIMATNGGVVKKWSGTSTAANLGGSPPTATALGVHLGRLWMNDTTNLDRLHYSTTGNPEEWQGNGDSGALDIGIGDGDPEGITCIFPTFQGELFVAKRSKLYRISGYYPETFSITLVSDAIGCMGPNAVALVDEQDIIFISEKGVHSLAAVQQFGDFSSSFISKDIQKTFNEKWSRGRLKNSWIQYLSQINCIALAVTDSTYTNAANKAVWLYNLDDKAWHLWPNISCQSMFLVRDSDKTRVYLGGSNSKIAKTLLTGNSDTSPSGGVSNIATDLSTGYMFPEGNPYKTYAFKKLAIIYQPIGIHNIIASVYIDNLDVQTKAFTQTDTQDLLGSTFVLGSSKLGYNVVLAPYSVPIEGVGRSIKVRFQFSGSQDPVEIYGFAVEYEDSGVAQESAEPGT